MFNLRLKEYREHPVRLSDYLPWALLVAPGIVQTKTGALMRTLAYQGRDAGTFGPDERVVLHRQLGAALRSLGEGLSLHIEVARIPCDAYLSAASGPPVVRLVDGIRRDNFLQSGQLFTNAYYLTLTYQPGARASARLLERLSRVFGGLFSGGIDADLEDARKQEREALDHFTRLTREFFSRCAPLFARAEWLDDDGMLTYLHSTISTHRHPIHTPTTPMYLDSVLPDVPAELGLEGMLGEHHLRVVSIKGYPTSTSPGILDVLASCPFELRFVTRYLALGQEEAIREVGKVTNLLTMQKEKVLTSLVNKDPDRPRNDAAIEGARDTQAFQTLLQQQHIAAGYHSASIVLWHRDHATCEAQAEHVMGCLRRAGFACVDESANLRAAWLATHPGNVWSNPRRAIVSSANLSHLLPITASWSGRARSNHIGEAPHVYARGKDGSPFHLNLNVKDVGHTTIIGPTGAGKSTLLCLLVLQWLKYRGAQAFIFDKGRSSRAITLAGEGQFLELSLERPEVTFQPLRRIDEPGEFEFALQWLEELCTLEGMVIDVARREALRLGLRSLISSPPEMRTLTSLSLMLQEKALRLALSPYMGEGAYAPLWDNASERFGVSSLTSIEMGALMETSERQVALTLRYLFHRLEQRFDGSPTLLVLDEAWLYLSHPIFAPRLVQWLRELRKKRVYVVFATQNLTDVLSGGELAATLIQNCPTQILLPNPSASSPSVKKGYQSLGLTEGEVDLLATATPKRDYLFRNTEGTRLFTLALSALELALVGASSPDDHKRIDALLNQQPRSSRSFAHNYLRAAGFPSASEVLP